MDSSDEEIILLSLLCDEFSTRETCNNCKLRENGGRDSPSQQLSLEKRSNQERNELDTVATEQDNSRRHSNETGEVDNHSSLSVEGVYDAGATHLSQPSYAHRNQNVTGSIVKTLRSQRTRIRRRHKISKNAKLKRWWVRPMLQNRTEEGEFHTLFAYLIQHETEFKTRFRMSYGKFTEILKLITPEIEKKNTMLRDAISPEERLAILLRYLATGDSFVSISSSYRVGISTVQNIVTQTSAAIWNKLGPLVMSAPTAEQWASIEEVFANKWGFPNCIGIMDGRSIAVQATNFRNTSVILLALIDANYQFLIIDVGAEIELKDGCKVLMNSAMGKALDEGTLGLPEDKPLPGTSEPLPHVVIGHKIFPLRSYMMCPYPEEEIQDDDGKRIFNDRISHVRRIADKAFEMLMQRFRFYYKKVQLKPETADTLLLATCCLHNFLCDEPLPPVDPAMLNMNTDDPALEKLEDVGGNVILESMHVQDKFKEYLKQNSLVKYEADF